MRLTGIIIALSILIAVAIAECISGENKPPADF